MYHWGLTLTWSLVCLILFSGSLNPYFLKYFELDFNSAEIEYFLKIKEGNQEGRIERKTKIDRIWIFKRTKPKFERLYIAFGDKNQSQVHGVVTLVKNIY